jgi:hypothetical protein
MTPDKINVTLLASNSQLISEGDFKYGPAALDVYFHKNHTVQYVILGDGGSGARSHRTFDEVSIALENFNAL